MIGARDMAFPRLNALSFWLLLFGGDRLLRDAVLEPAGSRLDGAIVPLVELQYSPSGGQDAWIFLIHLTGISSLVGAINFYVTIVNMRAPGMTWGRMPLFVWTILIYCRPADHRAAGRRRRGDDAAGRPPLRDPLLRPRGARLGDPLAAPVLVLRAPRGLHHGAAGLRDDLRDHPRVLAQADLRLQGDRRVHGRDRVPRLRWCGRTTCSPAPMPRGVSASSCSARS